MKIMSNIIVPFSAVVDAETAKIIAGLEREIRVSKAETSDWKRQAECLQRQIESHHKDIPKLKALKEKLEPACRDMMALLDIEEDGGWWY